jgi:hypothetical protein
MGQVGGRRARRVVAFVSVLAAGASSGSAWAGVGNDQPYPVGDQASGMGGAAVASVRDGAAPWYNPAGLGRAQATGVSASVSAYGLVVERTRNFYSDDTISGNLSGWVTAVFPMYIGAVKPLDVGVGDGTFRHAIGLSVVIPDYDRRQVNLSVPHSQFDLSLQERLLEQTLWVVPSWGGCVSGRLCFGVGFPGAYRNSSGQYSLFFDASTANANVVATSSYQEDSTQFGAAMQGGLQLQASPRWWIGVNVRTPLRTIAGGGTLTIEDVDTSAAGSSTPRRYHDTNLWTDFRLPLQIRAGVAYDGDRVHLALDAVVSMRQAPYYLERAESGGDIVQPRTKDGTPVGPPITLSAPTRRNAVVNGNVGVEVDLSRRTSLLAGFFTDFSATPKDQIADELHPRVHRLGLTLGVSRRRAHSTTYVTTVLTMGRGESFTFVGAEPRYEAAAGYINLGGSSVLDDLSPGEVVEKPPGKPLWHRWWFWTGLGAAFVGATVVTIIAATRSPGLPASDLGSQRVP